MRYTGDVFARKVVHVFAQDGRADQVPGLGVEDLLRCGDVHLSATVPPESFVDRDEPQSEQIRPVSARLTLPSPAVFAKHQSICPAPRAKASVQLEVIQVRRVGHRMHVGTVETTELGRVGIGEISGKQEQAAERRG